MMNVCRFKEKTVAAKQGQSQVIVAMIHNRLLLVIRMIWCTSHLLIVCCVFRDVHQVNIYIYIYNIVEVAEARVWWLRLQWNTWPFSIVLGYMYQLQGWVGHPWGACPSEDTATTRAPLLFSALRFAWSSSVVVRRSFSFLETRATILLPLDEPPRAIGQ